LRIGLVTGEYPPMRGGVGAFTEQLALALHDQKHQVHVITSRMARPEAGGRSLWDVLEPYPLGYASLHPRARRWSWRTLGMVAEIAVRYNLDVINIQFQAAAYDMVNPAIYFLPWRLRPLAPVVVTFHDLKAPYLFPKAGHLRQAMVRRLARTAAGAIVTNDDDHLSLLSDGIEAERLACIPIGSNISKHPVGAEEVQRTRRALGAVEDDILLGYFGFVHESKGPDVLVEALSALEPRYRLVFLGSALGESDLERNAAALARLKVQIDAAGLDTRIRWTGFLSDRDLSAHFQAVDLMVMPYREGVSLRRGTLMAILSQGRPLVTTAPARPLRELQHGRHLYLVERADADALVTGIRTVTGQPALARVLGEGAAEAANLFGWKKIAGDTTAFYGRMAEAAGQSRGRPR
jgi:glycosyltransferase involved in cell wall biosynthesis